MAYKWRTSLYLAASASAEFFADILLCPFEACKVRIQTQPGWARTLREGMPKLHSEEGIAGFVVSSHWQIKWCPQTLLWIISMLQYGQKIGSLLCHPHILSTG